MQKPSSTYPKRGEVWVADLMPGKGWEVAKKRPVVIISANELNKVYPLIIIIPLTTYISKMVGPERVLIKKGTILEKDSIALTQQIRSIDKSRVSKKIGNLPANTLVEIESALKLVLGLTELGS